MKLIDQNDTSNPLVTVVIPNRNYGKYIQQTISSVINQEYENIEMIIIDDGSSDDSVDLIQEMVAACQKRFVRFEFKARENKGLPATMNEALGWAKGKYFSYVSSDDIMLPNKTSLQVRFIEEEKGLIGVFGGAEIIDGAGNVKGYQKVESAYKCNFKDIFISKKGMVLVASTMLINTDVMKSVGGYDEDLYFEDRYMWLKLTHAGHEFVILPDVMVQYRLHANNISKNLQDVMNCKIEIAGMFKEHELYPYSMAQIYAGAALEYSQLSKKKSISFLFQSLKFSKKIVLEYNFIYSCLKILIPKSALNGVKRFIKSIR